MKRIVLSLATLLLAGCAPNPGSIWIEKFVRPVSMAGTGCSSVTDDSLYSSEGSLDLANGEAPNTAQYWIQVNIVSTISQPAVNVSGGTMIEMANRDRPRIDTIRLTYQVRKGAATKTLTQTDDIPVNIFLEPTGFSRFIGSIIGPKGAAALLNEVPVAAGNEIGVDDSVVVTVGVEARGTMSGSNTPITTGVAYFPITVFHSNTTCPNGFVSSVTAGCPFPGQDGTSPVCAP